MEVAYLQAFGISIVVTVSMAISSMARVVTDSATKFRAVGDVPAIVDAVEDDESR